MTLIVQPGYGGAAVSDPDAQAYLQAVEVADNQALEQSVQQAVNQFVIGCKADGIWTAIKASCILAGARTLAGALVPLVGAAPTPFAFLEADYNRKTGLAGDGSSKYLNSNRNNNADPQDNYHFSVYGKRLGSLNQVLFGARNGTNDIGSKFLIFNTNVSISFAATPNTDSRQNGTNLSVDSSSLLGVSRSTSASYTSRSASTPTFVTQTSATPIIRPISVFTLNNSATSGGMAPILYSSSRLAFYSIGESLDLALLDARVTALITAFAAIP